MADVRDILALESPAAPELTKESILSSSDRIRKRHGSIKAVKRPEGMHREVFALLYNDNMEAPPLLPTDVDINYKQMKARLGIKQTRRWAWTPFTNPARTDGAVFHHWRRVCDEQRDYPFAKFNKQVSVPSYSESEYSTHLRSEEWSKAETDHLLELAKRFDLRFFVIADRWDRAAFRDRTIEDLKERYYNICAVLSKVKSNSWYGHGLGGFSGERRPFIFDAEHERKRKEQLRRLFDRTPEQIEEELTLMNELKKIEARKKERERKTQDLQKLISQADSGRVSISSTGNEPNNTMGTNTVGSHTPNASSSSSRRHDRKLHKKKVQSHSRPVKCPDIITVEGAGIRFPEARGSGVWLRSQRMKLPSGVGQKKAKAIDQSLQALNIGTNPPPTNEICQQFNDLRSEISLAIELRQALASCEFELQALRHQYEALNPGKSLTIPPSISTSECENKPNTEIIDVVGSPGTPSLN
ncbi:DNA methyltransferase 1 associated protein 1 [Arctopsyche grandis]|uniref:DNA methyltransferase 1 associated protein 1 n=1 Tax=Arctopsyche grandis TaxID=121162 RepID=UPI00406D6C36